MSALDFRVAGLGDEAVDYLAAWDLQREVHAAVVGGAPHPAPCCCWSTRRCSPRASAPSPTSGPPTPAAAPVIDVDRGGKITFHGPGQLVGYPIVRLPDHVQGRRLRAPRRGGADRRLRRPRRHDRPGPGPLGRVAARRRPRPRAQGRRDRHPGHPRRDHARLLPQLRRRPGVVRPVRALRHRRRRRHLAVAASSAATYRHRGAPAVRRELSTYLGWEPYRPTADYDSRPEPGRHPRIELLTPRA